MCVFACAHVFVICMHFSYRMHVAVHTQMHVCLIECMSQCIRRCMSGVHFMCTSHTTRHFMCTSHTTRKGKHRHRHRHRHRHPHMAHCARGGEHLFIEAFVVVGRVLGVARLHHQQALFQRVVFRVRRLERHPAAQPAATRSAVSTVRHGRHRCAGAVCGARSGCPGDNRPVWRRIQGAHRERSAGAQTAGAAPTRSAARRAGMGDGGTRQGVRQQQQRQHGRPASESTRRRSAQTNKRQRRWGAGAGGRQTARANSAWSIEDRELRTHAHACGSRKSRSVAGGLGPCWTLSHAWDCAAGARLGARQGAEPGAPMGANAAACSMAVSAAAARVTLIHDFILRGAPARAQHTLSTAFAPAACHMRRVRFGRQGAPGAREDEPSDHCWCSAYAAPRHPPIPRTHYPRRPASRAGMRTSIV